MIVTGTLPEADYPDRIDTPVAVLGLGMITEGWELPFHSHRKAQ